jgi:hypothetical protein
MLFFMSPITIPFSSFAPIAAQRGNPLEEPVSRTPPLRIISRPIVFALSSASMPHPPVSLAPATPIFNFR